MHRYNPILLTWPRYVLLTCPLYVLLTWPEAEPQAAGICGGPQKMPIAGNKLLISLLLLAQWTSDSQSTPPPSSRPSPVRYRCANRIEQACTSTSLTVRVHEANLRLGRQQLVHTKSLSALRRELIAKYYALINYNITNIPLVAPSQVIKYSAKKILWKSHWRKCRIISLPTSHMDNIVDHFVSPIRSIAD